MSNRKKLFAGIFLGAFCLLVLSGDLSAQATQSIDKVYSAYLRNSGSIIEKGQIKGYYFLYQSDKIDRHTNEYTLQILDENLNKVRNIKFEDSKKLSLLESAYNGGSLSFLFKNDDDKTLDMKVYDLDGKLKYTYSRSFDRKTDALMKQYATMHTDEGMNKNVFDLGEEGYVSVMPMRDGKDRTYEVDIYGSQEKRQWTYIPPDDGDHYAFAEYLGGTDSLIVLEVLKKARALTGRVTSHLVGINFITRKKVFDIDYANEKEVLVPSAVVRMESGNLMLVGGYYDKDQDVLKDFSRGMAIAEMTTGGKIIRSTYNAWAGEFGRFLPTNSKGKIDDIGYLYIHRIIKTPDNRLFAVAEGYKRNANAAGIALSVLAGTDVGVTKIVVTDLVLMEFNDKDKVVNATIYNKTHNTALAGLASDEVSQHMLAAYLKSSGAFDYEFTTGEHDNSHFTICYSDYEHSSEYKGRTFNSIHYNGNKFNTDKIPLKTKATLMRVLPAKQGSVMILEYFKKDKRLDFRLEKLG